MRVGHHSQANGPRYSPDNEVGLASTGAVGRVLRYEWAAAQWFGDHVIGSRRPVPENHVAEASLKCIMNKPELDSQDRRSVRRTPSGVTLSSKRYAETEYIRKAMSIMKRSRIVLALIAVSSMLLAGCCSVHHADKWEYKVTQVPGAPQETANMRGPSLEEREKYLNSLGNDGWILVSEDLGVFYLKRPKK